MSVAGAVIIGLAIGAIVGTAINWMTRRTRRPKDAVIRLVDVSVTEAEAILAEPGVDPQYMAAIVPEHPLLDITLRNDGNRTAAVVRMHLELKGPFLVPTIDDVPPVTRPFPQAATTGPLPAQEPRQPPSFSYAINFPLQEGCYAHMVRQALAPGEVDRFVVSLVAQEQAEHGTDVCFYQVILSLDCGRARNGSRRRVRSEPITVLASRRPGKAPT